MTDFSQLVRTPLPSCVRVEEGTGGLPRLSIDSRHGHAEVYFQGAHVAAWRPAAIRDPVLWLSGKSVFERGKPIRGGVPICFPWFGGHRDEPAAPPHGFARLREWTLVGAGEHAAGTVALTLELEDDTASPGWPHPFHVTHRITVGPTLRMDLEVRNTGSAPFTFEEALHTYFDVADVRGVSMTGLEDTEYLDKVAGLARKREGADPIRVTSETDRIYLDTRATCVIHDPGRRRDIAVSKIGSDATVVWNPWIAKARAMPDFGDDEWPGMVCVETCNVNAHARTLSPGDSHRMAAVIEVRER